MIEQKSDLVLVRKLETPASSPIFVLGAPFHIGDWIVPQGFDTDLASVPRIFRWAVSKMDGIEAAVLHDYLCRFAIVPRPEADRIYREVMEGAVSWWRRQIAFGGARIGGWLGVGAPGKVTW